MIQQIQLEEAEKKLKAIIHSALEGDEITITVDDYEDGGGTPADERPTSEFTTVTDDGYFTNTVTSISGTAT